MHAVYNYCGFVDIAEALSKSVRTGSASDAGVRNKAAVDASGARDVEPRRSCSVNAAKR